MSCLSWSTLTYHDWATILGSLLLASSSPLFQERFGCETMTLERILMRHTMFATGVATGKTAAETTALENIPKFAEGTYQLACTFLETVDDKVIESRLEKVETDGDDEAAAEAEGQDDKDEDDGDDEDELEDDGGDEGKKHDQEEEELDEDDAAVNKSMTRKRKTQKMLKRKR